MAPSIRIISGDCLWIETGVPGGGRGRQALLQQDAPAVIYAPESVRFAAMNFPCLNPG